MALTLTRKPGEAIVIDGHIVVRVTKVRGNRVSITTECPDEMEIHRGEVQEQVDERRNRPSALGTSALGKRNESD